VPEPATAPAISPDGRYILFVRQQQKTSQDYLIVPLGPKGLAAPVTETPRPFIVADGLQRGLDISPDSRLAAYETNETGDAEVYITTFPSGEGKWQISRDGATAPRWSASGDRLYYQAGDHIREVMVERTPAPAPGTARDLVSGPAIGARVTAFGFERSLDGSRFLVVRPTSGTADAGSVLVIEHWIKAHLKTPRP
jgi:dipeptidyl aminopeptidase/acylaminoacyl peptidase